MIVIYLQTNKIFQNKYVIRTDELLFLEFVLFFSDSGPHYLYIWSISMKPNYVWKNITRLGGLRSLYTD